MVSSDLRPTKGGEGSIAAPLFNNRIVKGCYFIFRSLSGRAIFCNKKSPKKKGLSLILTYFWAQKINLHNPNPPSLKNDRPF